MEVSNPRGEVLHVGFVFLCRADMAFYSKLYHLVANGPYCVVCMKGTTQWRLPICAVTGTKDDENIGAQELHSGASGNEPQQQQQSMHGLLTVNSPRSSSLLIHAALKVFTWAKVNIFAESREVPATVADQTQASTPAKRRRGHQRTQSVTQPQLFVVSVAPPSFKREWSL
ncbi:hypothetical protein GGI03_004045 [Coemansia sp. RSA 2337]|nr:hypothetical protein GGI03_004045 [Coemansia sp. RSA 2337]